MRCVFFIIAALLLGSACAGQNGDTIWLNSQWGPSSKSKASFFRFQQRLGSGQWQVRDFFLDGTLQMRGTYLDVSLRRKEGKFEYYYKTGNPASVGYFTNGLPTGMEEEFFNEKGTRARTIYYLQDTLLIRRVLYDSITQKVTRIDSIDNIAGFVSTARFNRSNGRMVSRRSTWRTEPTAWKQEYFDSLSGHPISSGYLRDQKRSGEWIFYDTLGRIAGRQIYGDNPTNTAPGDASGTAFEYHQGSRIVKGTVQNATGKGRLKKNYDKNGNLASEGNLSESGERQGIWKFYNPVTGVLSSETTFLDGVKSGRHISYDAITGKRRAEGSYQAGSKTGIWLSYAPDGATVRSEASFEKPGENYYSRVYSADGQTLIREGYANDKEEYGPWRYYFESTGTLRKTCTYLDGKLHDTLKTFYPSGALRRMEITDHGKGVTAKCYTPQGHDTTYTKRTRPAQYRGDLEADIERLSGIAEQSRQDNRVQAVKVRVLLDAAGKPYSHIPLNPVEEPARTKVMQITSRLRDWDPGLEDGIPIEYYPVITVYVWKQ